MGQFPGELGFAVPYEDEPMAPKVKVLSKLNCDHLALKMQYLFRENPGHNIYLYNQMERSGDSASAMLYGVLQVLLAKGVPPPFLMEIELQSVKKFDDLQLAWVPVVDLKYGARHLKNLTTSLNTVKAVSFVSPMLAERSVIPARISGTVSTWYVHDVDPLFLRLATLSVAHIVLVVLHRPLGSTVARTSFSSSKRKREKSASRWDGSSTNTRAKV